MKYAELQFDETTGLSLIRQVVEDWPDDAPFDRPAAEGCTWEAFPDDWAGRPGHMWDGQQVMPPPPPPPEVIDARIIAAAEQRIDAIADQVYTSSVSRGARYERKYAEAERYRAAGYPGTVSAQEYPFLTAEAPVRGLTKRQLADAIIAAAQGYEQFAALAEARRTQLKVDVPGAADEAAKQAAADALVSEVQQAAQALQQ